MKNSTKNETEALDRLEAVLEYTFQDKSLPLTALTHSSYANEHGLKSYERLEFLGDAILGFAAAEYLFENGENPEGELTKMRAALVCEPSLAAVAQRLSLSRFIRLGKGEDASGGRSRPSLLCDIVEALIGAMYLDGGLEPAKQFIQKQILSGATVQRGVRSADYKTLLQEYVQRDGAGVLSYRVVGESGPDHAKVFEAEALINGEPSGRGSGHSKKEAEQAAAHDAMTRLGL